MGPPRVGRTSGGYSPYNIVISITHKPRLAEQIHVERSRTGRLYLPRYPVPAVCLHNEWSAGATVHPRRPLQLAGTVQGIESQCTRARCARRTRRARCARRTRRARRARRAHCPAAPVGAVDTALSHLHATAACCCYVLCN
jgi:hypothetical protein